MSEGYRCPPYFSVKLTGLAIREYLAYVGEGYPYEFYVCFKKVKPTTSYASVRRYFYILKKLGLIEPVRTEPSSKGGFPRTYYRIVIYDDPRWLAPQEALYPETALGKKRYKAYKMQKELERYPYAYLVDEILYYFDINTVPDYLHPYINAMLDEIKRTGKACKSVLDTAIYLYSTGNLQDAPHVYRFLELVDTIAGTNSRDLFDELVHAPSLNYLREHGEEIVRKYCG